MDDYLQHFRRGSPFVDIHFKAAVQKVLEDGGQLVLVFNLGLAIGGNQIKSLQ